MNFCSSTTLLLHKMMDEIAVFTTNQLFREIESLLFGQWKIDHVDIPRTLVLTKQIVPSRVVPPLVVRTRADLEVATTEERTRKIRPIVRTFGSDVDVTTPKDLDIDRSEKIPIQFGVEYTRHTWLTPLTRGQLLQSAIYLHPGWDGIVLLSLSLTCHRH